MAHPGQCANDGQSGVCVRSYGTHRTGDKFQRRFYLRPVGSRRIEFSRSQDGRNDLPNFASRRLKDLARAFNNGLRRIISNKPAAKLGGNESRCRRMMCQQVEHLKPVFHASARRELVAKDYLWVVVMHSGVEIEFRLLSRPTDCPTRQTACNLNDVLLRIAAVDAKRVKLHQLAAVIFV